MVCKKMYGGGMGDQIRRYCDEMESDVITFNFFIDFGNNEKKFAIRLIVIIIFFFLGLSPIERNRKT